MYRSSFLSATVAAGSVVPGVGVAIAVGAIIGGLAGGALGAVTVKMRLVVRFEKIGEQQFTRMEFEPA